MPREIKISVRALVIGGLCALILMFAVLTFVGFKRGVVTGFKTIDAYIGACQEAGVLPTPDQLNERLAAVRATAKAEPEEVKK